MSRRLLGHRPRGQSNTRHRSGGLDSYLKCRTRGRRSSRGPLSAGRPTDEVRQQAEQNENSLRTLLAPHVTHALYESRSVRLDQAPPAGRPGPYRLVPECRRASRRHSPYVDMSPISVVELRRDESAWAWQLDRPKRSSDSRKVRWVRNPLVPQELSPCSVWSFGEVGEAAATRSTSGTSSCPSTGRCTSGASSGCWRKFGRAG